MQRKSSAIVLWVLMLTFIMGCSNGNTISVDGSTSVEKVIGALGEMFEIQNKGVTFTFNPTGSGTGITAVAEGRCDIGVSSRSLTEEEKSKGLTETLLALDGIAVIVNIENNITDLSLTDLAKIYKGEIKNWKEIGGNDGQIVLIGREAGSGTRTGFEEVTQTKDLCDYRQELTSTGDIITTVSGNPNAIGYASLASVKDNVKTVAVDGIEVSEETIKNGSYKIQRPYVVVTKTNKTLTPTVQRFFDYITSFDANEIISKQGVVPVREK